jgi:hypothetical protein
MRSKSVTIWMVVVVCLAASHTRALVEFNDGGTHNIDYTITEEVWVDYVAPMKGTTVNLVNNGYISSDLEGFGISVVNILGGSIADDLQANDSTTLSLSGGTIGDTFYVSDNSNATMSGGSVGELSIFDNSSLTIIGSGFAVDGNPFGYGELTSILGGSYQNEPQRRLTGTLDSGESIDNIFYIGNDASIVLVPEPSTLLLLGLGAVMLRRKQ